MKDRVYFTNSDGVQLKPYADLGIIVKSYDVSPPMPKIKTVAIDGRDGDLDLTEWAGEVKFENRTIKVSFRDMSANQYGTMVNFLLGRSVNIFLADDNLYYYKGRASMTTASTAMKVTDLDMEFTCNPFKLRKQKTTVEKSLSAASATIPLKAERMTVTPEITLTRKKTLKYNGKTWELAAGTYTLSDFKITDKEAPLVVSGTNGGKITLTWRDGAL